MTFWPSGVLAHLLYIHLLANCVPVDVSADPSFQNQPTIAVPDLNGMFMRISFLFKINV